MEIYVNLERLKWFQTQQNPYDISRDKKISYGGLRNTMSDLLKLGLIEKVGSKPSIKNSKIDKEFFQITEKGKKLCELFGEDGKQNKLDPFTTNRISLLENKGDKPLFYQKILEKRLRTLKKHPRIALDRVLEVYFK
jgi:hypothetical protein